MKTLVLSMISIAATVAAMTACTSESDPMNDITNPQDEKVEIKLNAGIGNIASKAAIESDVSGLPSTKLANVFLYKQETNTTADWSGNFTNGIATTIATDGKIDFGENTQYYPVNNNNVYFVGLYTGEGTAPTFTTGSANLTITGKEDILYALPIDAGKRSTSTDSKTPLSFTHKLTQIKFTLQKENGISENITISSMKITKVGADGIHNACSIALADGSLSGWNGNKTDGITIEGFPATALSTTASTDVTTGVMVEPEVSSIEIEVGSDAFPGKTLTSTINAPNSGKFEAGTSYKIALTVKATSISGTATIQQWTENDKATGNL